jgi:hypothetical protein
MSALDEQANFLGGLARSLLQLPPAALAAQACVVEILERCAAAAAMRTSRSLRDAGSSALFVSAFCTDAVGKGVADCVWAQMAHGVGLTLESVSHPGAVASDDLSRSHALALRAKFQLAKCCGSVHSQESWSLLQGLFSRIAAIGGCYTSHATVVAVEWLHELLQHIMPMSCAERIAVADQLHTWYLPPACADELHHALTEAIVDALCARADVSPDERLLLYAHTAGSLATQIRSQLDVATSAGSNWLLRLQQLYHKFSGLMAAACTAGVSSPQARLVFCANTHSHRTVWGWALLCLGVCACGSLFIRPKSGCGVMMAN